MSYFSLTLVLYLKTSRIKAFVFKFISVPAKGIRTARQFQLIIYTDNKSYQNPFALADG
jgi:hypothetical protein